MGKKEVLRGEHLLLYTVLYTVKYLYNCMPLNLDF